jgi:hypothetical protein
MSSDGTNTGKLSRKTKYKKAHMKEEKDTRSKYMRRSRVDFVVSCYTK